MSRRPCIPAALLLLVALAGPAAAEITLPPGFAARLYVTGEGFTQAGFGGGSPGVPSASTLGIDRSGVLWLARTGRRYSGGEVEDLWPLYRFPPGGARVTPDNERAFLAGPPVPNPQVSVVNEGRDVVVTTYDRDRHTGVLYRLVDGRAIFVAGGTPDRGVPALLRQPEGVAADAAGRLYVADREQGVIVRLDADGRVLDARWLALPRPRVIAADRAAGRLWIGADAAADMPWMRGPGEIWAADLDGAAQLVLRGPVAAAIAVGPGGHLFVADRAGARVFALAPDGRRHDFAAFTDSDAPRALAFAPDTPETRAAGIAGDLFVVVIRRGAWPVNEIVRISGPFADFLRGQSSSSR